MNILKHILCSAAIIAFGCQLPALAQTPTEVVKIKYSDGVTDYIPTSDISQITFTHGIDTESPAFTKMDSTLTLMKALFPYSAAGGRHDDFGFPSLMLATDVMTADMYTLATGYDHFSNWAEYKTRNALYYFSPMTWLNLYSYVVGATEVLRELPTPSGDEEKLLAAQALGLRSFCYWVLAQLYAPNYSDAPDHKCIVLVNEENYDAARNGTPMELSTSRAVYERMVADITRAIEYLSESKLNPAHIDPAHAKRYIDLGTAYGLLARFHLTMHDYAKAAAYARRAIETSSARPLLPEYAGRPGFNDAKSGNWMWAITVDETDLCVQSGIVNRGSHLTSFSSKGYTSVGAFKQCGPALWDYLRSQEGDVRRNWFVDSRIENNYLNDYQRQHLASHFITYNPANINVKFDVYRSDIYGSIHAEDVPLMRIEEMYLIEAEGLAMSGRPAEGCEKLNAFVQTYRNPSYDFTNTVPENLQDEIYWQRRLELWGEGQAYFDMVRLGKDLDKYGDPYHYLQQLRIRGGSRFFQFALPTVSRPQIAGVEVVDDIPQPGWEWNE